jgi:hypothetical protein
MLSRSLAVVLAPVLPFLPLMMPVSPAHTANFIIAGVIASLLAIGGLWNERARVAAAVVGGWVALSPFVLWSTLPEKVVTVCWGTWMFVLMAGPFSHAPDVTRVAAAPRAGEAPAPLPLAAPAAVREPEPELPVAA